MADLYSNTNDGRLLSSTTTWAGARDDVGAASINTSSTSSANFTAVNKFASRGGGSSYRVERSFMYFDTSGITINVLDAKIKIRGVTANDGSIIAVKSTAFGGDGGTALNTADINNIVGWSNGSACNGCTDYSNAILAGAWSTSAYNTLIGTSDLKSDMKSEDVVIICFLDYTNDYQNLTPPGAGTANVGAYYTDYTGTSRDPYIEYTLGYGHEVNTVVGQSIGQVNGVATSSIKDINTVDS